MSIFGILYFSVSIILLIWAKVKLDIKVLRVLFLSFLPLFVFSILIYIYSVVNTGEWIKSINIVIIINLYGSLFYYPVLIASSLFVKILQKYGNDIATSATLGSMLGAILFVLLAGTLNAIFPSLFFFVIGYLSVIIEDKIFNADSDKLIESNADNVKEE